MVVNCLVVFGNSVDYAWLYGLCLHFSWFLCLIG